MSGGEEFEKIPTEIPEIPNSTTHSLSSLQNLKVLNIFEF